jgi:hypothetical protein
MKSAITDGMVVLEFIQTGAILDFLFEHLLESFQEGRSSFNPD